MKLGSKVVIMSFTLVFEIQSSASLLAVNFRSVLVVDELVVITGGCQIAR
jgi:hypothetical protein